jgi:hypothetical protein
MPPTGAPIQELPIITTENGIKSIYAFHLDLKQIDLGYKLPDEPNKGRPVAPHHVHIYADTVELADHLVLPGKNVGIFARKVKLTKSASIDVTGPSAKDNYKPGDVPQQKDMNRGAKGSLGANGSGGEAAGNVTIVADELIGATDVPFGTPLLKNLSLPQVVGPKFQKAIQQYGPQSKLGAFSIPVEVHWNYRDDTPCRFLTLKGSVEFPETPVQGFASLKVDGGRDNGDGKSVTVLVSAQNLKADMPAGFAITECDNSNWNGKTHAIPFTTDPFSLQAEVEIQSDESRWKLVPGAIRATASLTLKPGAAIGEFENLRQCALLQIRDRVSAAASAKAFAPALKALAEAVCVELNRELAEGGAPSLVVLAQGGTGGRGQDGHEGMEGAKGENGRPTSTYVVADPVGRFTTPPETYGQKGKPGGQGGDAGHSGDGGAGGAIVLNFMKAAPVSILLLADAGAGGAPATPGARGRGGAGGDGADFYVHKYNSNEVEQESGPDGPRGEEGPPASFHGNRGNAGTAGKIEANGAKVEGMGPKTFPAYSYDKMALSMKLDQLLMVQRIGKLTFLNADSDADYQFAASLFLWLCNVCPESVTKGNNALTVEDRNARAAICNSARVEMLRLQRGLDYFGHPYNWAPVLSLRHNQKRVTELVGLGKIVEDQVLIYNDTNKSVAEKLAALNKTVAELAGDLTKTDAANAVLQKQIEAAENACTSLQKDIENQVAVMRRGQAAVEDEIRKKVDAQCNLENVINVTKAVVTVGSGAFDVVGAIKGGKELMDIFDEAKKAAATIGQAKDVIEKIQKTVGDLNSLGKQLSTVTAAVNAGKPDSIKIAVLREEFEENIKPLIKNFPSQSKELRTAVRTFFDLNQARNEKILAYNALFVQKAELKAMAEQLKAQIQSVQTIISENKQSLVPVAYTSFFRSALDWSKQNLIHLLYEGSRAFYYHTATQRKDLMEKLSDLNVAALANTQARLLTAYDDYLRSVGRPYGPITDIRVTISKDEEPALFEGLAGTGRITFKIDHTHPEFEGLTLVKVESVAVALPGIKGGKSDVLNIAMTMAGEGAVRPADNHDEKGVVHFNCPPRPVSFRYSYDPDRRDPIIEPGLIADDEFSPLSPFTTWTLDFGLKNNLNKFLKLAEIKTIELHFNGHAFGRRALRFTKPK